MPDFRRALFALLLLILPACTEDLAQRMVAPPNGGITPFADSASTSTNSQALPDHFFFPVGPPAATLSVWLKYPTTPARGTVLLLHGFLNNHQQLDAAASALQSAGYRAVLVDLRGHGQSSGDHITYGVQEASDLTQLTTELQRRGLCGATIGVYGTSYGAATAILYAAADPRVSAVVAVASFATLREEAPHFGRVLLPVPGDFLSDADYTAILDRAGQIASFNPDAASPLVAIKHTHAQILLVHGNMDLITPAAASEQLHNAAPDHSQLTILSGQSHLGLSFDLFGELHDMTSAWFDKYLASVRPLQGSASGR